MSTATRARRRSFGHVKGTKLHPYQKPLGTEALESARQDLSLVVPLGTIDEAKSYPKDLFMRITGVNRAGLKEAESNGLRIAKVGNRKFIRGADWHAYLEKLIDQAAADGGTPTAA